MTRLAPTSNQQLTLEWTDGAGIANKLTGLAYATSMSGAYGGMTNIELEVSNVRIEQTDPDVAQLDEVDKARPEVSRTAAIVVKELTINNFKEAQRLAGAPDEAVMTYIAQTFGGFKVTFTWTD